MTALAQIAEQEWRTRLAYARRQVSARQWSREEADARLMPWLAIALRAGAMPPEAEVVVEDYLRAGFTEAEARTLAADYLCDLPDLRAELARARDAAIQSALERPANPARAERSHALQSLAIRLGSNPPRTGEGDQPQAGGGAQAEPKRIAA